MNNDDFNYTPQDDVTKDQLNFYPSQFQDPAAYAPSSPYNQQYQFTTPQYAGPVSIWAAFGSGGLPNEPPLLEGISALFST